MFALLLLRDQLGRHSLAEKTTARFRYALPNTCLIQFRTSTLPLVMSRGQRSRSLAEQT